MTIIRFNVAQLLREEIGARRAHQFAEPTLPLDDSLTLRTITGDVRFTRTATGVYAQVTAHGTVTLTCVRSLEPFDYPVSVTFADEFHSLVDVITSTRLAKPTEEDPFMLTESHMADVGEAIREYTLLALPIKPVSPAHADAPVQYTIQTASDDETDDDEIDVRLRALKNWSAGASGNETNQ